MPPALDGRGKVPAEMCNDYMVVKVSYIQERRMADIVRKQMVAVEGATVRSDCRRWMTQPS